MVLPCWKMGQHILSTGPPIWVPHLETNPPVVYWLLLKMEHANPLGSQSFDTYPLGLFAKRTLVSQTGQCFLASCCTQGSICQIFAEARFKRTDRPLAFKARQLDSTLQAQLRNMIGCLLCKIMKVAGAITAKKEACGLGAAWPPACTAGSRWRPLW